MYFWALLALPLVVVAYRKYLGYQTKTREQRCVAMFDRWEAQKLPEEQWQAELAAMFDGKRLPPYITRADMARPQAVCGIIRGMARVRMGSKK